MSQQIEIGRASLTSEFLDQEGGVVISIPFEGERLAISYEDEDLDNIRKFGLSLEGSAICLGNAYPFVTKSDGSSMEDILLGFRGVAPRRPLSALAQRMDLSIATKSRANLYIGKLAVYTCEPVSGGWYLGRQEKVSLTSRLSC